MLTVDPRHPRAQAFAVKAGRFAAVGASADIKSLADQLLEDHAERGDLKLLAQSFRDVEVYAAVLLLITDGESEDFLLG